MKTQKTRTAQQIREDWLRKGVCQNEWARRNGFSTASVSHVLNGRNAARRGVGHKIAVMLGMKDGEICE